MKKILFSLAALAALSMVAVGCKKASDGAKAQPETLEQKRVREGRAIFAAFDKIVEAAKKLKDKQTDGVSELKTAVADYEKAFNIMKADFTVDAGEKDQVKKTMCTEVTTNLNTIKVDALKDKTKDFSTETKDAATANTDAKIKEVYELDSGNLKSSCKLGELKTAIDKIKAKAPYKK